MSVETTIERIRTFVARPGWSRSRLAREAGLSVNALSGAGEPAWNPTADTLRAAENLMNRIDHSEAGDHDSALPVPNQGAAA